MDTNIGSKKAYAFQWAAKRHLRELAFAACCES
jgi:hypothetical protein